MGQHHYRSEVIIVGGGLAGISAAFELLNEGHEVLMLEKGLPEKWGGLAKESFGGIHLVDTPHQRKMGIKDSVDLAYQDWLSYAEFSENKEDELPRSWAKFYCQHSVDYIYHFLREKRINFLPIVNWPERGFIVHGNRLPRWHVTWGTGREIILKMIFALENHPARDRLKILFSHSVEDIIFEQGQVKGVVGKTLDDSSVEFQALGEHIILASGGMCGGNLEQVKKSWDHSRGEVPKVLLNGAHIYGDGHLQLQAKKKGAVVSHWNQQWHYAAGIHHPAKRKEHDGLSLVPPRSGLWLNARGERFSAPPLIGYTDTRYLVDRILQSEGQYSWMLLNYKIAKFELAVSGSEYMKSFRDKSKLRLLRDLIFGNKELVDRLIDECPDDFVVASNIDELMEKMQSKSLFDIQINREQMLNDIFAFDQMIERGVSTFNDDQLRWIANFRRYRGDKVRMCHFQKILDKKAFPLIAIRQFILTRKSLGGLRTDLNCRVLNSEDRPIQGLYAIGETAGFGGGGIHGKRSLEGTFLGSCVLTGRKVAESISGRRIKECRSL